MRKQKFLLFCMLACMSLFLANQFMQERKFEPSIYPEPRFDEEQAYRESREKYRELIHKAAPGTDWKAIEAQNAENASARKKNMPGYGNRDVQAETFAGGLLTGDWVERGSQNLSGSVRSLAFQQATNTLYNISDGGSLWKRALTGSVPWTLLNDDIRLEINSLALVDNLSGGNRILAAYNNNVMYYSDNDGASFTQATGISFPVVWGSNQIVSTTVLNDVNKTVYVLAYNWNSSPFEPRYSLYISTDRGLNYSLIYNFPYNANGNTLSVCNPYNTTNLFIAEASSTAGQLKIYQAVGSTVTQLSSFTVPTGANVSCQLSGSFISGNTNLYALLGGNKIYVSANLGLFWSLSSTLANPSWGMLDASNSSNLIVYTGDINARKSTDVGVTFAPVNEWYEYYGNITNFLHADMMYMKHFQKSDGTKFNIICTHGGVYVSYDEMVTRTCLSLTGHNVGQFYDVVTDPDNTNYVFAGSQDQGLQRNLTANTPGTNVLNFQQVISGDYGQMALTGTGTNKHLWTQYPGGVIYYYPDALAGYQSNFDMTGTQVPNYDWMLALARTPNSDVNNEVLMGGGNITGGAGSYMSKLTALTTSPYTITATQFPYNFRASSNNAASGITAIECSNLDAGRIYVATEDGTFFYSNDNGVNWTKSAAFTGPTPWYLYGSSILASKLTSNLVWFAGSGYSNPGVFKSTNGGVTFTAMNTGLPSTLVYEIVANTNETQLYAATEAGPYVYIVSQNQWYPMIGAATPTQSYTTVEYLTSTNVVRFATYGRGIWDFRITNSTLPLVGLKIKASKVGTNQAQIDWSTETETNTDRFVIQKSNDGINFNDIGAVAARGNTTSTSNYQFVDAQPFTPITYYRIKQVDKDRQFALSSIVSIRFNKENIVQVLPNPVGADRKIRIITGSNETMQFQLLNQIGSLVFQTKINGTQQIQLGNFPQGTYNYRIVSERETHTGQLLLLY
jgi:hypothetical protein